jgi:hypothetical protein
MRFPTFLVGFRADFTWFELVILRSEDHQLRWTVDLRPPVEPIREF